MKSDLEQSLEVSRKVCKGITTLLKHGFDVDHALELKDQFMHDYLKLHHKELYETIETPVGQISFYLIEADEFNKWAESKYNNAVDEMCFQYLCSRKQKTDELLDRKGLKGTQGYKDVGCYDCNGLNKLCGTYATAKQLFGD